MEFYTLGVYHSTEKSFFDKLIANKIDMFCDIRLRRGVRGANYVYANNVRLREKLAKLRIAYQHVPELATPLEVRQTQTEADKKKGEGQRERTTLSEEFKKAYKSQVLDKFDLKSYVKTLEFTGFKRVVLFCVEENAEACHRSLVAEKLNKELRLKVTNL